MLHVLKSWSVEEEDVIELRGAQLLHLLCKKKSGRVSETQQPPLKPGSGITARTIGSTKPGLRGLDVSEPGQGTLVAQRKEKTSSEAATCMLGNGPLMQVWP